ncbi:hypothetical protein ABZP36_014693 [Zizania latifolia]
MSSHRRPPLRAPRTPLRTQCIGPLALRQCIACYRSRVAPSRAAVPPPAMAAAPSRAARHGCPAPPTVVAQPHAQPPPTRPVASVTQSTAWSSTCPWPRKACSVPAMARRCGVDLATRGRGQQAGVGRGGMWSWTNCCSARRTERYCRGSRPPSAGWSSHAPHWPTSSSRRPPPALPRKRSL